MKIFYGRCTYSHGRSGRIRAWSEGVDGFEDFMIYFSTMIIYEF